MAMVGRRVNPLASVGKLLAAASTALGCTHGEPPTPPGSPSVALPDLPGAIASAQSAQPAQPVASNRSPSLVAPPPIEASTTPRPALPQTHDKPSASGPAFDARRDALWAAIVDDDPDRAMPFFFPLEAYEQVKDVGDPAGDWRRRLVAAYKHDIHALHARLGGDAAEPRLTTMAVPDERAAWVDPGEEWNKVGYYRVYGSKLHFMTADHGPDTFDVKSLISWRGEWFVVHLSAIK